MKTATQEELIKEFGELQDCSCHSCGFETSELNKCTDNYESGRTGLQAGEFFYCDVCCGTFASNAHRYPSQYKDKEVMRMLAYCTNTLLKAMKDKS